MHDLGKIMKLHLTYLYGVIIPFFIFQHKHFIVNKVLNCWYFIATRLSLRDQERRMAGKGWAWEAECYQKNESKEIKSS